MGVHQSIQTMEALRKKCLWGKRIMVLPFVIMFPLMMLTMFMGPAAGALIMFAMMAVMVLVVIMAIMVSSWTREFKMIYKEMFTKEVLTELLGDVDFNWQKGFTSQFVSSFGIVNMGNRFDSSDYVKATYKGVEFMQSDVVVKHCSGGKNKHTTTYFRGKMMKFSFPKKDILSLQIFTDNFGHRAYLGYQAKKIEMEDVEFNRVFDVKSVNEHDAFYVLTPPFMERLKILANKYPSVGIHLCRGEMYIAINTSRDTFDADLKQEIIYPRERARMQEDVQDIMDIIDALEMGE